MRQRPDRALLGQVPLPPVQSKSAMRWMWLIPMFLVVEVALLVVLVAWGYRWAQRAERDNPRRRRSDGLLFGPLLLTAFASGAYLFDVLLDLQW